MATSRNSNKRPGTLTGAEPVEQSSGSRWFDRDSSMSATANYLRVFQRMIKVIVYPDGDGFGAAVPSLPGVVSCGDTEDEAFQNIDEALRAALESYADDGVQPPWCGEDRMIREVVIPVDGFPPNDVSWNMRFSP